MSKSTDCTGLHHLTNIEETPLHTAFDACNESANKRGLRVTGSEIVGMVPKSP